MMLVDSHAHLYDRRYNRDRDRLIKDLENSGVEFVINNAENMKTSIQCVNMAQEYENIYATVGFHPHNAKELDDVAIESLRALAAKDKVVAIGEIGLDFYRDLSPRDVQREAFKKQLDLAKELDMPVTIHSRDASQECFDMIKEAQDGTLRGVMHCYSDGPEMAKDYLDLGFYISLAGPVTYRNARSPKETAKVVPLDRLLIETDAPWLTPEPNRGKRNEPAYVRYVAGEIAEIKGISFQELAEATTRNAKELFGIK